MTLVENLMIRRILLVVKNFCNSSNSGCMYVHVWSYNLTALYKSVIIIMIIIITVRDLQLGRWQGRVCSRWWRQRRWTRWDSCRAEEEAGRAACIKPPEHYHATTPAQAGQGWAAQSTAQEEHGCMRTPRSVVVSVVVVGVVVVGVVVSC